MRSIFKKREKIIFCIAITVIFFNLIFNFLISPLLDRYAALDKEINTNQTKLEKYRALMDSKKEIEDKYTKFSLTPGSIKDTSDSLIASLAALENLAKNADIKILDIRPEQGQRKNNQNTIELRAEGSIEGYTKFVYDIGNSLMLLKISRCQLTAKTNARLIDGTFTIIQADILK